MLHSQQNGEEVPPTAIPTVTEPVTREIMNSSIPINRRKKRRRKSSSSSGKWAKIDAATDNEDRHDGHGEDDRTTDCDPKNEETSVNADDGKIIRMNIVFIYNLLKITSLRYFYFVFCVRVA